MLTLYSSVGFYLFGSKVFGDTSETNKLKGPRFLCLHPNNFKNLQRSWKSLSKKTRNKKVLPGKIYYINSRIVLLKYDCTIKELLKHINVI